MAARGPEERLAVIEASQLDQEREVERLRRRLHEIESTLRAVDLFAERQQNQQTALDGLRSDLNTRHQENKQVQNDIRREVSGLRRTLLVFAFTIAASAVGIALSVLISTGKI